MTNRKLTSMVLSAATLLGASSAFASIDLPSTGNGELVLFVTDTTTGNSYAKDLGIRLNDILPDSSVAGTPGGSLNYLLPSFDLSSDANFQTLINSTSAGNLQWAVLGADTDGSTLAIAPYRVVQTSVVGATPGPNNNNVKNGALGINSYFTSVSGNLDANGSGGSVLGTGLSGGMFGVATTPGSNAPAGLGSGVGTSGFLGDTLAFYMFTSGNTSGGGTAGGSLAGRVYNLANLTLTAAGLSAVVTTEVPLPAALWLFGSGLLGMVGVGRRRKLAAA